MRKLIPCLLFCAALLGACSSDTVEAPEVTVTTEATTIDPSTTIETP